MNHVKLLSVLLVALATPLPAAAGLHAVEVVVFARLNPGAGGGELLGKDVRPLNLTGAVLPGAALAASRAALPTAPKAETYAVVGRGGAPPRAPRRLDGQARLLEANVDFRVLYHEAWVQEVDTRSNSIPVRVSDAAAPVPDNSDPILRTGELDGTVRVYRGRYYQVDVALEHRPRGAYARPADPYAPPPAYPETSTVYVIDQHRRIKTGETHYFDHPRFGVLLRIDPLAGDSATP